MNPNKEQIPLASRLKIIFMGTPEFAASSLQGLIESGQEIVLTVTQPDKPSGRGLKLMPSPVKILAQRNDIPVVTPSKIKSKETINRFRDAKPDLFVVSAYGKILPNSILEIPKHYSINVHASLLPKYRGAAPINWSIIKGERETGVTIMKMNERMDEGDIMIQKAISIEADDDASSLHDKLALVGRELIKEAIFEIKNGNARFRPQRHGEATYAPMLKKQDGLINWNDRSINIHNFIRGMNPWPGAFSYLKGKMVKIFKTKVIDIREGSAEESRNPGVILGTYKNSISVATIDGAILVEELQQESRKKLCARDFLQGSGITVGDQFTNVKEPDI